jgi:hypothetical protein
LLSSGRRTARSVAERFHIKWAAPHKCPAKMCTAVAFLPSGLPGSEENTANKSILRGSYRLNRPGWNLVSIICTSFPQRCDPPDMIKLLLVLAVIGTDSQVYELEARDRSDRAVGLNVLADGEVLKAKKEEARGSSR